MMCGRNKCRQEVVSIRTKRLLLGLGICVCLLLAAGLISAIVVLSAVSRRMDGLKSSLLARIEEQEDRDARFRSIAEDLAQNEPELAGMTRVGHTYGWGMEMSDPSDQYFFFLPDALRPLYGAYWLEGVDPADYYEGLNRDLGEYGDPVFCAADITELCYLSDVDYGGVPLAANETCYLVALYDQAVYYRYVCRYENAEQYALLTGFDCGDAPLRRYIYRQENGGWTRQQLAE